MLYMLGLEFKRVSKEAMGASSSAVIMWFLDGMMPSRPQQSFGGRYQPGIYSRTW